MTKKFQFRLLSWVTLLVFPAVGLTLIYFFDDRSILSVFELEMLWNPLTLLGLEFGLLYGFFILLLSQSSIFEELSREQTKLIQSLNLNWLDVVFVAFCAGFGEEILFRASIQTWMGPVLTSVFFIAIHGYFNPKSWKKSRVGFSLLPFILILAFAYESFGLWFCVAAHFSYDFLMFAGVVTKSKSKPSVKSN